MEMLSRKEISHHSFQRWGFQCYFPRQKLKVLLEMNFCVPGSHSRVLGFARFLGRSLSNCTTEATKLATWTGSVAFHPLAIGQQDAVAQHRCLLRIPREMCGIPKENFGLHIKDSRGASVEM